MPIPGYTSFRMAADLYALLFPRKAKSIDGDDPKMIFICEALDIACKYGEDHVDIEALARENERLRAAVRNQCGDNLCWLTDPEVGKALPAEQFLESCKRYHAQLVSAVGVIDPPPMTIAQLEAEVERLRLASPAHSPAPEAM